MPSIRQWLRRLKGKGGKEIEETFEQFSLLPREIQCEIINAGLDFETILTLMRVSSDMRDLIYDCLTDIYDPDSEARRLLPGFVLKFPRIARVSYPVIVESIEEVNELLALPHLREITLSLETQRPNWELVNDIIHALLLRAPFHETCDSGEGRTSHSADFNYRFIYSTRDRPPFSEDIITGEFRITPDELYMEKFDRGEKAAMYWGISDFPNLPIKRYHGELIGAVNSYPCLEEIEINFDDFNDLSINILTEALLKGIAIRLVNIYDTDRYIREYNAVTMELLSNERLRNLERFIPFFRYLLPEVTEKLPHLKEIAIIDAPPIDWSDLGGYEHITIYSVPEKEVIIPPNFKGRVEVIMI